MIKTAEISECGLYRYHVGRSWDASLPSLTFVMLNPSTADAELDDPTIRRCIGFAKREDMGAIHVVNLFAYRATNPANLPTDGGRVGPDNEKYLHGRLVAARDGMTKIVCAWGAHPLADRSAIFFKQYARAQGVDLYCLGHTKDGHPRHPLYVKGDQPLELFS